MEVFDRPTIEIKFDEAKLRHIEAILRGIPNALPKIISRGINRTASPAKTDISREIRQEINITAGDIKEKIKLEKATYQKWSAEIYLSHSMIPILDFGAKQTSKGVSFKVYKSGGRKFINRAFIATMQSGHKGVFRRGIGLSGIIRAERRHTRPAGKKYAITQHNIFIGEQFGPSLYQVFKTEKALPLIQRITEKAYRRLEHNIDAQVEYILGQSRVRRSA